MFKEMKGLEYTLEILRALHLNPGQHDSRTIHEFIERGGRVQISLSYVQKILPRLAKSGLLTSAEGGYNLSRPVDEIPVSDVLGICEMPDQSSPLYSLCRQLKEAVSLSTIDEFYDFH